MPTVYEDEPLLAMLDGKGYDIGDEHANRMVAALEVYDGRPGARA